MYRKIDMSGRICIPSEMREKINLDVNSEVKIELLDNEIIITNCYNVFSYLSKILIY